MKKRPINKERHKKEAKMAKRFLDIAFSGVLIVGILIAGYIFIIAYCAEKLLSAKN